MEAYVQLRWLCKSCGEWQQFCYPTEEPEQGTCPKCGRVVTTRLARCTGKVTWFEPYCTKPKRRQIDWVKGGRKDTGRSTGRPRKKELDNTPYCYSFVEVIEDDLD